MTAASVTMVDVHAWLSQHGESRADQVAEHFWPERCRLAPSRGGPSRGTVIALRLLGRMRAKGTVGARFPVGPVSTLWYARGMVS